MPRTRTVQVKRTKLKQQADFLAALAVYVSVVRSCKKSKVPLQNIYDWLKKDEPFKKFYEETKAIALAALEDEAVRRAHEGVLKPVFQGGKKAGVVRVYSDTLLIVLLKANAPQKYKERFQGKLSGPNGAPIESTVKFVHVTSSKPLAETEDDVQP